MAVAVKLTDLKNRATEIVRKVERGEEYLVTKRGRPVAMLLPVDLDDDELADWLLVHHPEAIRRRREAERRIAAGDYVTVEELKRLPKPRRRRTRSGR